MRVLLACVVAVAVTLPAFAQNTPKPTITAKSRFVEIDITIDEKLRSDKRLHDGILREARQYIDERSAEVDKLRREEPDLFRRSPWTFERGYYLDVEAGPYIGVSVLNYSYSGGAHPNHRTTAILWNREQGQRTTIRDFFREAKTGGPTLTALATLIREEIAKEKEERDAHVTRPLEKDEWISAVTADLTTMGATILVPSREPGKIAGIDFHFSQYDVGAYAEGAYSAFLSWRELEPFLTEQARALFGGERADVPQPDKQ